MVENKFDEVYDDKIYLDLKENYFSYLCRKKAFRKEIKKILPDKNDLIIDVGCGITPIIDISKTSIFLDASAKAVAFLKKRGAHAITSDITHMNIKDKSIEVCICSETLEHVCDDALALKEIYRILKPNGTLILSVPLHKYYHAFDDDAVGHFRRYNPKELIALLKKSNFSNIYYRKIGNPIERIMEIAIVFLFTLRNKKSTNKKASDPKYVGVIYSAFKIINWLLFCIVYYTSKITPLFLTSVLLVVAKKSSSSRPHEDKQKAL